MGRTAARGHARAAAAASRHAPAAPRRVSGPIRPGHPRPAAAVPPGGRVAAPAAPATTRRQRTGTIARLRALSDHRLLDTLLRSRAWIWLMGIALGGIVAMQVSLLKMNAGIGTAVQASQELEHANSTLEEQVAELSSGERVGGAATALGLVVPDAGSVGYLTVRPGVDAARAARTMTAPSDAARQLLAAGGVPGGAPVAAAATTATAPSGTVAPTATGTAATPTPTATATAAPTAATATAAAAAAPPATATPVPTVTPMATATTAPAATTTTGAAAAPAP